MMIIILLYIILCQECFTIQCSIYFVFQSRPVIDESFSNVEKLTNRVDDLEAKCLYCGGKMDTLIATLQDEVTQLTGLNDETENTLLLSIAGLKHVSHSSISIGQI